MLTQFGKKFDTYSNHLKQLKGYNVSPLQRRAAVALGAQGIIGVELYFSGCSVGVGGLAWGV